MNEQEMMKIDPVLIHGSFYKIGRFGKVYRWSSELGDWIRSSKEVEEYNREKRIRDEKRKAAKENKDKLKAGMAAGKVLRERAKKREGDRAKRKKPKKAGKSGKSGEGWEVWEVWGSPGMGPRPDD